MNTYCYNLRILYDVLLQTTVPPCRFVIRLRARLLATYSLGTPTTATIAVEFIDVGPSMKLSLSGDRNSQIAMLFNCKVHSTLHYYFQ